MGLDVYSLVKGLMNQRAPVFGAMDGDFKLPRKPVGFDDPGIESFYRFLRANGLTVREVPQSYLLKRFPHPVAMNLSMFPFPIVLYHMWSW